MAQAHHFPLSLETAASTKPEAQSSVSQVLSTPGLLTPPSLCIPTTHIRFPQPTQRTQHIRQDYALPMVRLVVNPLH